MNLNLICMILIMIFEQFAANSLAELLEDTGKLSTAVKERKRRQYPTYDDYKTRAWKSVVSIQRISKSNNRALHMCGGVIIGKRHVLSAFSCKSSIKRISRIGIFVGSTHIFMGNRTRNSNDPNVYEVSGFVVPKSIPGKDKGPTPPVDIFIMNTKKEFNFGNPTIQKISISKPGLDVGCFDFYLIGWKYSNLRSSDVEKYIYLQDYKVTLKEKCYCHSIISSETNMNIKELRENTNCAEAGYEFDAKFRMHGSPIISYPYDGSPQVVFGIFTKGSENDSHFLYVPLHRHYDWIMDTLEGFNDNQLE